jgi:hypothetical protein
MMSYRARLPNGSGERLPRTAPRFVQDCSVAVLYLLEFVSLPGPFAVRAVGVDEWKHCRPTQSDDVVRHVGDRDIAPCCGIVGLMLNAMMDHGYQGGQLVGCHRLR